VTRHTVRQDTQRNYINIGSYVSKKKNFNYITSVKVTRLIQAK